jgi:hypothetical protein
MAVQIDYRAPSWGHTVHLVRDGTAHESGAPLYSGWLFSSSVRPLPGVEVLVRMASGRVAVFELTDIRWATDPDDMYHIKAYPTRYLDD